MKEEILICDCHSADHQIILSLDEEDKIVYAHIHVASRSFWYRVKYAFKYIFGYKSKYGAWDEFIFKSDHAPKLQEVVDLIKSEDIDLAYEQIKAILTNEKKKGMSQYEIAGLIEGIGLGEYYNLNRDKFDLPS